MVEIGRSQPAYPHEIFSGCELQGRHAGERAWRVQLWGRIAWGDTLNGNVTAGLPSEEFIGCTLQGATGPDTLKERPRLCRYSVWEPEEIP